MICNDFDIENVSDNDVTMKVVYDCYCDNDGDYYWYSDIEGDYDWDIDNDDDFYCDSDNDGDND